jgi:dipeptide/tripeptide permease
MEKGYSCCVANLSTAPTDTIPQLADARDTAFFGHPRGLSTLFFTEMWERFSYYGMRALLILFMTAAPAAGGLGFDTATAGAIYGLYTSMVYMTTLPGGWIADRLIGPQRAVLYGGILIASGHFLPGTVVDRDRHRSSQGERQRHRRPIVCGE